MRAILPCLLSVLVTGVGCASGSSGSHEKEVTASLWVRFLGVDRKEPTSVLFQMTNGTSWVVVYDTVASTAGQRTASLCSIAMHVAEPGEAIVPLVSAATAETRREGYGKENRYTMSSIVGVLPGETVILKLPSSYFEKDTDVVWVQPDFAWQFTCDGKGNPVPANSNLRVNLRFARFEL